MASELYKTSCTNPDMFSLWYSACPVVVVMVIVVVLLVMVVAVWHGQSRDNLENVISIPYILAYKSLSRISRPPKKRVPVWSKIVDPCISRRWFLRACSLLDASLANNQLN